MQLQAGFEQFASAGFLQPAHWLDQPLGESNRTHWLTHRMTAGVGYQSNHWRLGIAREQQTYARANTNALVLAAQDKANREIDLSTPGNFPLHAEVWKLSTTAVSAAYKWQSGTGVYFELEPFLQTIHDFEYVRGDLLLLYSGSSSSQLTGQVSKTGSRSYGFMPDDKPDQGWGSGLNIRTRWDGSWGKLKVTVFNAWNRQEFSAVHQSHRQYNISTTGNKIQIADLPAVTGEYGLTQARTRLPAFWQSSYEPAALHGLTMGAMGLGQSGVWTAGYSNTLAGGRWWLQTAQARNWTAGYGYGWPSGWRAALSVSGDGAWKSPLLSSMTLSKSW